MFRSRCTLFTSRTSPRPLPGSTPWTRRWICRRSDWTRCGAGRSLANPSCPPRLAGGPSSTDDRALSGEGFDHRFAEFVQRVRRGEISEPHVEPLNALTGQAGEMSGQFVGVTTDQARPEIAEPSGAHLAHHVRVAALTHKTDHLL